MVTPAQAAEKFAREWLESKPTAITNYSAVANALAGRAIAAQATMITRWTAAVTGATSKWRVALQRYVGNNKMETLYTQKLNSITEITDAQKAKISASVTVKQFLRGRLDAVLTLYKNANTGQRTVPAGITDVGLRQMLMSGILNSEPDLSASSTDEQIRAATVAYMGSHYGWPLKA